MVPPADRAELLARLEFPVAPAALLDERPGEVRSFPGYTVYPLAFRVFDVGAGFDAASALWLPATPSGAGVLVAQGHFGQGKSAPEAQEIAHRLALRGYTVLAVDTPGIEEWDVPGRRIHFDEGGHERGYLVAGGTSALALQVAILRRGIDVLSAHGVDRVAVTGASGGAVQAFYLALADPRVRGAALASYVPIPREARASGCACDQIPGWPGPDPGVLALLDRPTLWLSDVPQPEPTGLPDSGRFEVHAGPHGYSESMQRAAVAWIDRLLDGEGGPWAAVVPLIDLAGTAPQPGYPTIFDLPLAPTARWEPDPWPEVPYELDCVGVGPVVVVGGGSETDRAALREAGMRACEVTIPEDEAGLFQAVATGRTYADRQAGGLAAAARRTGAVAAWGDRAWGLAAAGIGLPFVVRDPVRIPADLDPARDPPWVHVPGAWWGAVDAALAPAAATDSDPALLARALAERLVLPVAP